VCVQSDGNENSSSVALSFCGFLIFLIFEDRKIFVKLNIYLKVASHADVLRGSSLVSAPRGQGTRDEPLRMSAWEANLKVEITATI